MSNIELVGYHHPGMMVGYSSDYIVGCPHPMVEVVSGYSGDRDFDVSGYSDFVAGYSSQEFDVAGYEEVGGYSSREAELEYIVGCLPCMGMIAGKPDPLVMPKGWSRIKPKHMVEWFTEKNGREPNEVELACLKKAVAKAWHGIHGGRDGEWEFEHGWFAGIMTVAKGRCLTSREWDAGEGDHDHNAKSAGGRARLLVRYRKDKWKHDHPSGFFASLGHAFTSIAKVVTHIPVLGSAIKLAATPFDMVAHIAKGERLDHVMMGQLKSTVNSVKEIGPYVTSVVSFVPGIGTGVAAAIAAGTALVEGKRIDDALMSAARNAIPGGEVVQHGFNLAVNIAKGKNVAKSVLAEARSALPGPAQKAFDIATALSTGRSMQSVLMNAAGDALGASHIMNLAHNALDVGEKLGAQRIIKVSIAAAAAGDARAKGILKNMNFAKNLMNENDRKAALNIVRAAATGNPAAKKMLAATILTARRSPQARRGLVNLIEAKHIMAHGKKAAPHAREPRKLHPALAVKVGVPTDGVLIVRTGNKYRLARGKFAHHAKGKLSGVLVTRSGKTIHSVPGTYNKG